MEDDLFSKAMRDHPKYRKFIDKYGPDAEMDGMSPMGHITFHVMAEQMLRSGEMPEMQEVLDKLTAEGTSRHDAIHMLAKPLTEEMWSMNKEKRAFDKNDYIKKIRKLTR